MIRRHWASAVGLGVALAVLGVYFVTLSPGVPPTDSGELALAAWVGGVAHAPGFPTYTLLGWLWSHLLPVGRVIWRLNVLSALCGAAAAAGVYALARASSRDLESHGGALSSIGAAAAALAFSVGRTAWSWSTVTEVYALNTLLITALMAIIMWWGVPSARPQSKAKEPSAGTGLRSSRLLVWAALLFGLGLGTHLTSTALLAPGIAVWLVKKRGWGVFRDRAAIGATAALALGLSTFLYLPWRAASDPILNWGDPETWQRFWSHVTASQYRVSLWSSPVGPQVAYAARLWWWQYTPVGLVFGGWGAWRMARHDRARFWFLALVLLFNLFYAWSYVIEDDQDAYYLPGLVAGAVWVAWGMQDLSQRLVRRLGPHRRWLAGAQALALIALPVVVNWNACDRHRDTIAEDYAVDVLVECEPGSVVLTRDWQFYGPSLYLQRVEQMRPDVTVIDTELVRRGWYLDYMTRVDGGLMAGVESELRHYRVLRDAWERGELPIGGAEIAELQAAYLALTNAWIDQARLVGRAVYAGPNRGADALRGNTLRGQLDMEPGIGEGYWWVPVGLTFHAMEVGSELTEMPPLGWRVSPFSQVWLSAPERKIAATRSDMAALRGMYHASQGFDNAAEQDWRTALQIEPGNEAARRMLGGGADAVP